MPVVVNRRKHKISINLGAGKRIILSGGETAEIGDKEASSMGMINAVNEREVSILSVDVKKAAKAKTVEPEKKTEVKESEEAKETEKPEKIDKSDKTEKKDKNDGDSW